MLKISKLSNEYFFILGEKKGRFIGIEYYEDNNKFYFFESSFDHIKKNAKKIDYYEIFFNEKNTLNKINEKIKKRIKYLNSINNKLSETDFLLIYLNKKIEECIEGIKINENI